jgi:hypothetical protein
MTAYKWLPSEPTDEMVNIAMTSLPLSMPEVQVKQIYSLLWKAAPEVEQKPFGYAYQNGNNFVFSQHHFSDTKNTTLIPLYTTPQHEQESVKLTAVDDLMTRVSSTSPVLRLPDEVMSSEALFEFITNTHPPKREPLSIDTVMSIVGAIDWNDLPTAEDEWAYFTREIEKAHGIESNNG